MIDLGATNETFITKGETLGNFYNTPTKGLKFNHRVNTTLNQLVI